MRAVLVLLLALCPAVSWAEAWPRPAGEIFAALSWERWTDDTLHAEFYGERGFPRGWTLGLKYGRTAGETEALAFTRRALPAPGPFAASVTLGSGLRRQDGIWTESFTRVGVAVGRGFDTPAGPGWAELALRRDWNALSPPEHGADTSLGLTLDGGAHAILQLRGHDGPDGTLWTLAPSYVHPVNTRLKVRAGALWRPEGGTAALSAGTWLEF